MFISEYTVYTGSFRREGWALSPLRRDYPSTNFIRAPREDTLIWTFPRPLHWRHRAGLTLILDPIKTLMHVLSQQAQGVRSVHTGMQFSRHEFGHEFFRIFCDSVWPTQRHQHNTEVRELLTERSHATFLCIKIQMYIVLKHIGNSIYHLLNYKKCQNLPVMNFMCSSEYRRGLVVSLNDVQRLLSLPEAKCVLRYKGTGSVNGI